MKTSRPFQSYILVICCTLYTEQLLANENSDPAPDDSESSQEEEKPKDRWSWLGGFIFAPQAKWDFDDPNPAQVSVGGPLFVATSVASSDWILTAYYNTANNNQGLFIGRNLLSRLLVYGTVTKSYDSPTGYGAIGIGTPMGFATGFVELGSDFGDDIDVEPVIFFGAFIPLFAKITSW